MPVQAVDSLRLLEVEAPIFSYIRLIDDGKVVSPTSGPLFTPRMIQNTTLKFEIKITTKKRGSDEKFLEKVTDLQVYVQEWNL
jgi:hypothetical protein